ncbi:retron Eco8 family effector endonuclease [Marinomonas shanghaiensis]|uniref:retron Eco8 family effector endonuclease n=1 Tax=Marinomonas shanghaiensis TaxID=2202418 RepID=UPI000DB983CA|nr:retron Eco8 family effector endonuclease [Marinomonas shanghaiensis]
MTIKSIKIKNLLSFDDFLMDDINDFNCIIGKNNVGKSNLLKLLRFFYNSLNGEKVISPELNSKYDSFGSITLTYDLTRIKSIVRSNTKSAYLKNIYNVFFKNSITDIASLFEFSENKPILFSLTLKVFKDGAIVWSDKDSKKREGVYNLFPFFDIDSRHIDLYDWNKVWDIVCKLNTFNLKGLSNNELMDFLDDKIANGSGDYKKYVQSVEKLIDTKGYSYRDKVLSYIKIALKGHDFVHFGEDIKTQSDGTNSHKFIEIMITLLISLTRREYISPFIFVDEPEVGLHPRLNEQLINRIYDVYMSFKKTKDDVEVGKYKTPYPKVILSTHSPNILKQCIKLFKNNQRVYHFTKKSKKPTRINVLNSTYSDARFINSFGDNEARLFFSDFILFVEGQTEIELFGNFNLSRKFPILNRIDVYGANNVTLKYIAPSYSNASIPYMVLYDLDKIVQFDYNTGKLKYIDDNFKLKGAFNKERFSLYSNFKNVALYHLDYIFTLDKKVFSLDSLGTSFLGFNNKIVTSKLNFIANKRGYNFLNDTIEGLLICNESKWIFERWIVSLVFGKCYQASKNPRADIIKMKSNSANYIESFNKLFTSQDRGFTCDGNDKLFLDNVKKKYLREVRNKIRSILNKENEVVFYRLIFEGKTDSLISIKNNSSDRLDEKILNLIKQLKENDLKVLSPYMKKTSGWVTEFLDFSILEIEKLDYNYFMPNFKLAFPELSYILEQASSSIEVGGVRT